jgi:hypothetical protein
MKTRSACGCLLCQLELHLARQLRETPHENEYQRIATSSPLLSPFPSVFALIAHLRTCRSNGNGMHPADAILLELLRLLAKENNGLLRDVLLLSFIPVLHSVARQITRRYRSFPPDDTAQHLVASFLEALGSPALLRRSSHLAFALSRNVKRNSFDWAERETRSPGKADHSEPLAESAAVSEIPEPFEQGVVLRHFLFRCQRQGLITVADLELLVHIKLEGNLAEQSGEYSNALRQKIKRLLRKLRSAARIPSSHRDPAQSA